MTIPEDVKAKAYELLVALSDDREPNTQADVELIARAILAERERATAAERERHKVRYVERQPFDIIE